eukprot:1718274-Amphidinium_carterae.1
MKLYCTKHKLSWELNPGPSNAPAQYSCKALTSRSFESALFVHRNSMTSGWKASLQHGTCPLCYKVHRIVTTQ